MDRNDIIVKSVIQGWQSQVNATDKLFAQLSDQQLMQEIAPGRNRGIYLLGHLTAVHDLMLPLLRFQQAAFPELQNPFVDSPDKTIADLPAVMQLREQWKATNSKLSGYFESTTTEDWFTRHSNISEEDFKNEPHRNRLNVVLNRTIHLSSHRGQLILLANK